MHFRQIHEKHADKGVEVVLVVSAAKDSIRQDSYSSVRKERQINFTLLDDPNNTVAALYGLNPATDVLKVLVIDRKGTVRHIGEFTPLEEIEAALKSALE